MPRPPHKLSATLERRIRRAATAFVVFVAVAAAVLSFSGLHRLALDAGFHPYIAWLFPIATDVAVAAFSLAVVHHTLAGMRVWYPWLCMLLGVGVSVAGNVWAAPDGLVSRLVHAWPPVVFALAFEALARLLRHRIEHDLEDEVETEAGTVVPSSTPVWFATESEPASGVNTPVAPVSRPAEATRAPSAPTPPEPASESRTEPEPARQRATTSAATSGRHVATEKVEAATPKPPTGTVAERVIEVLRTHQGQDMSHSQIANLVGADRSNVSKTIKRLRTTHPELFDDEGEG